ncbi:hypothetical protein BCR35DRAFT_299023 [Leucosporidium creatinivorum]|uniref:Transcription initiation factor TFIID subunit 4 n=1 Tax=Leucosporidium creatinivorum TaxID=106004 RepID=A0A1Y2G2Z5_9BASI|nr:hypothetical protein BCR35DRAFT_299023 [Leucosporidium creatinivorum]
MAPAARNNPQQLPSAPATPQTGGAGLGLGLQGMNGSAAPSPRPGGSGGTATRAGSADPDGPSGGAGASEGKSTNVDELMDAVGASGLDIGAEEESLRLANERLHAQHQAAQTGPVVDRSRKQDFIDQSVLADVVKKIAAAFQLRTLEPDTIPLIALATRHRLSSLINDAIAARDHRRNSSHLRPPPFALPKKKRKRSDVDGPEGEDGEEEESEEEDAMDEFNLDFLSGGAGGGKGKEKQPAWDSLVLDDGEKLLGVLERVDREEERKKRRERMLREQKEQEERDLAEAIAASEAAERELADSANTKGGADKLLVGGTPGGSAGPSTPRAGGAGGEDTPVQLDKNGKPKKPRKKKTETPSMSARNMSEDVKKRLTDQVAMRSLGGKNFSWLNAGPSGGMGSPSPAGLPKPRFAPASSLPPPTFNASGSTSSMPNGSSSLNPSTSAANASTSSSGLPPALSRLSGIPPLHDASRARRTEEEWERGANITEMGDLLWVLERERGAGVGKGSGRNVLWRARAGVIKR